MFDRISNAPTVGCAVNVGVKVGSKCMELVTGGCCTRKELRLEQTKRNLFL